MFPAFRGAIALALLGLAAGSHSVLAQGTDYGTTVIDPFFVNVDSFTTTTDTSSPTFNRPGIALGTTTLPPYAPSGIGTAVGYATQDFTPSQDATYRVTTTIDSGYAATGTASNLVQLLNVGTFDPTDKTFANTQVVYNPPGASGSYTQNLSGGQAYTFVNGGRYNVANTGSQYSLGTVTTSIDQLNTGSTTFIPDPPDLYTPGTPVSQTLTLSGGDTVTALNSFSFVGLQHPYLGDLTATLNHNGISVNLFNQVGADPTGNYGQGSSAAFDGSQSYTFADSGANLATTAAATVASYAADQYATYFPLHGGTFQSLDPLNTFDGTGLAGDWTLTMTDNKLGDTGSFLGFSFNADTSPVPEASTWTSMGLGLVVLGGLAYKRRTRAAARA